MCVCVTSRFLNPFMPSGLFYHTCSSLDRCISYFRDVRLDFIIIMFFKEISEQCK